MRLTLETDRLILRPFELDDAESMFNNWQVMKKLLNI